MLRILLYLLGISANLHGGSDLFSWCLRIFDARSMSAITGCFSTMLEGLVGFYRVMPLSFIPWLDRSMDDAESIILFKLCIFLESPYGRCGVRHHYVAPLGGAFSGLGENFFDLGDSFCVPWHISIQLG